MSLEICLTAICIAIAVMRPQTGELLFARAERVFSGISRNRGVACVAVGALGLGLRAALLPILPLPQPSVSDEYSYLLLADTLAHGRLANPTHPMWIHFETFHVNWHPTYASMYYPGYALFLAFGQVVLGHPFWGVWLSCGLMCGAICWALQGWLPSSWALLGGVLAVIRLGTFSYWADSYWGGSVTALGGALVIGSLPRLFKDHPLRNSLLMALGMALLAGTRPYEGLFFCVPVLIAVLWQSVQGGLTGTKTFWVEIVMPAAGVVLITGLALGYYFWRVTGSPFTIPYQLNMRTYGLAFFPWEKLRPVEFHHVALREFYRGGAVLGFYELARTHPLKLQFLKAIVIWLFFFGPILTLPWIAWIFTRAHGAWRKAITPELRFLLVVVAVTYVSLMLTIHIGQPHYAAPLTAVFYLITLILTRDLYNSGVGGRFLARSVPLVCLLLFVARASAPLAHATPPPSWTRTWCSQDEQNLRRARILQDLNGTAGKHLVIVHYKTDHNFILDEWVFNGADIDGSKVVWARDMGAKNEELIRYFAGRRVWLLEPDYNPVRLSPYVQ